MYMYGGYGLLNKMLVLTFVIALAAVRADFGKEEQLQSKVRWIYPAKSF